MNPRRIVIAALAVTAALAAAPSAASADVDPAGCTDEVEFDSSIRTFEQVIGVELGAGGTGTSSRRPSQDLYTYLDAIVADTAASDRVRVVKFSAGTSTLGRDIPFVAVGTPENIANLDAGRDDAAFWRGVRTGSVSEQEALAEVGTRPAFAWITANVHGNEPAGGEASLRLLYELVARTDCANAQRLDNVTTFIMPSQNPDGRDNSARTNAWAFDLNRDWGTLTQSENLLKIQSGLDYPSVVYVDAHQQNSGYFFPPNEDPIHHEISDASIDAINGVYGPALQKRFNDQSIAYQNYNTYDLFAPEYGDSAPSLLFGAAGMTYEKGTSEAYGKQVYDHYLALDETINVTSRKKRDLLTTWIEQWAEATQQGAEGYLEPNEMVSPLHSPSEIVTQPDSSVYGYYYLPDNHAGDAARLVERMQETGVHVYRLDQAMTVDGVHQFGPDDSSDGVVFPAGTLWIPSAQPTKHWLQAVLGERPYQPYNYCYDVCTFSFSLLRGMSGNGYLTKPLPGSAQMTEIADPDFGAAPSSPQSYYAFATDSSSGLSMMLELLDAGAEVTRATTAFTAGDKSYPTGTAIVDGSTLPGSVDIADLAEDWETPVAGLSSPPAVARYEITEPKIALYVGNSSTTNPLASSPGMCSGTYCQSLFVLTQKLGVSADDITLVTSTALSGSATSLTDGGYTAFINPSQTIAAGTGATALQNFVNAGGRYVSWGSGGATSARNAGMTNLNTQSISNSITGATYDGSFTVSNPVAWGFDNGGFIFRSSMNDPAFDPATLTGTSPSIPDAVAAVSYPDPLTSFGYSVNTTASGQLPGRPAAVDQPFGSGHAVMLAVDPTYRAWVDGAERLLLNAVVYPTGAEIPASSATSAAEGSAAEPIADSALPAVSNDPVAVGDRAGQLRVAVDRADGRALRKAVRRANPPKKIKAKARFKRGGGMLAYVVPKASTSDTDDRPPRWVLRLLRRLDRQGVTPAVVTL